MLMYNVERVLISENSTIISFEKKKKITLHISYRRRRQDDVKRTLTRELGSESFP